MRALQHRPSTVSAIALAAALLWGLIELAALWRARWLALWRQRG